MGLFDSLFGSSPQQYVPPPPNLPTFQYDPNQIAPTQASMLGGIGNLGQFQTSAIPQYSNIAQGMISDPNAAAYQDLSQGGQALGLGAAANAYGAGGNIYQQAFDPQSQLYQQLYGQTTDAARANEMAAGLGTSPLGAYATSAAQNNFNINWQNAQLQRMMQGGQAAAGLQQGAFPLWMQSAAAPWQVGQTIGGANLGTLSNLQQYGAGGAAIPQMQIGDWSTSIGQMGNLQNQMFNQQQSQYQDQLQRAQLQMQAQAQAAQQQAGVLGGLGKIAGGIGGFMLGGPMGAMVGSSLLGGGFGGGGGGGGGGMPTGWGLSAPSSWSQPMGGFSGFNVGSNLTPFIGDV
jgi:hypothetical protein